MNIKHFSFAIVMFTLSTGAFASESYQELVCDTEAKVAEKENSIYRDSLHKLKDVDHYANIKSHIEPLKEKSKAIVKKNCLAGKDYKEVAPEIKKLWTEGCAPIVNGPLNIVCMNFMALNDGSTLEKMLVENPSLAEIVKRAKGAGSVQDCSPGVSHNSIGKEDGLKEKLKDKVIKGNEKQ